MSKYDQITAAVKENNAQTGTRVIGHGYLGNGAGALAAGDINNRLAYYWQPADGSNMRVVSTAVLAAGISYETSITSNYIAVDLGYEPNDGRLKILRQSDYAASGGLTVQEQKVQAATLPTTDRIATLRARVDGASMILYVDGPFAYINPSTGAPGITSDLLTLDATGDIPGVANQHRVGLFYFDPTTGALGLSDGTAATPALGSVPSRAEIVTADVEALKVAYFYPIAVVYLYNGQTELVTADLLESFPARLMWANWTPHITPLRVVTAAGAITVTTADYTIVVNKSIGGATTVNLPANPATGLTFVIKDGKADANTNNITLTPAAGNIDGAGTHVMNVARSSRIIQYTGSEWSVIGGYL